MEFSAKILYLLDLFGTMSFAFSGAIRVVDRRPDFIGMLILAGATGIGGATLRDTILNRDVMILKDPTYSVLIILSVVITFFFPHSMVSSGKLFQYFDAIGLGVFSAITANVAWGEFHMHPIPLMLISCFCGCAGGVVRDLVIQKPTVVLSNELVVTPVLFGVFSLIVTRTLGFGEMTGVFAAVVVGTGLRAAAVAFDLRMPRVFFNEGMLREIELAQQAKERAKARHKPKRRRKKESRNASKIIRRR